MRQSDPLSPEARKEFGNELENIFEHILKRADKERQESEPWKQLFEASEQGLRGILSEAKDQMMPIVLNTTRIIELKFGIKCSNKLFNLVKALPYVMSHVSGAIHEQQGLSCCSDKARQVYYQEVMDEIKHLIEKQSVSQNTH